MDLLYDIKDIIRNYDLTKENGFLFCLYEAVSNSLYCCMNNDTDIKIKIEFTRQYKANEINKDKDNYIKSFKITDNGIGFTDDNFEKFTKRLGKTNHTGGKGLGRIAFLKVFNEIIIDSFFKENSNVFHRKFSFSTVEAEDNKKRAENKNIETIILFNNIKSEYQKNTIFKDIDYYYNQLINHFYIFLYYLTENKKNFEIKLIDDEGSLSERIINTEKIRRDIVIKDNFTIEDNSSFSADGFDKKADFEILHIKTKNVKQNKALYVVDERSAGEIKNLNLPPNVLEDETGNVYFYNVYLKSRFFKKFLNESRTHLSLPTNQNNPNENFITSDKIEKILKEKIEKFLSYEIKILEQKNERRIKNILCDVKNNKINNNKAYLYLLSDQQNKNILLNTINYDDTENKVISKIKSFHENLQEKTIEQINKLLKNIKKDKQEIDLRKTEEQINTLFKKINIENTINLSSYIMYRKYVLNLFKEALDFYKKSKKNNEEIFHNLLLAKNTKNSINSNLWLLDDLFLYFEGTSEKSIKDIKIKGEPVIRELTCEEESQLNDFNKKRLDKRIDLLFFPEEKKCIIIELKDPGIGVNENIQQMDKYAELLANFIKPEFAIDKFYTYLITDNFNIFDKPAGYRKIYGIDGFVRNSFDIKNFYNDTQTIANEYSEVIRYTDIYERAYRRNEIFFKKLNID